MAKIKRDWVEPAHPVLVRRFDDLVDIYRFIKDAIQPKIDKVFDKVSQQIGFVVTTTLPVTMQINADGKIEKVELGAGNLQGTVFEREFAPITKELTGNSPGKVAAGSYSLFFLWHEALKLKLKADWIEPAHFIPDRLRDVVQQAVPEELVPGVREPAHWFDAGIALAREEEILIAAIDEVYTDLKLAERIAVARRENLKFVPGIREPAHFRDMLEEVIVARSGAQQLVPGIREPAHFRRLAELLDREDALRLVAELTEVLKKYGL
ncbi:hypothetical protein KI811_01770 [Geobacter hydrogenophilus]|uniref:Uncharacterized protein n=1 Tax=Geobacter hydrogenophilus TaxID=40983 RepID=A0A9W6LEW8_9BACT|nr:hypothetical protein [Geobacter hydrogenophilus]MBT0892549.1 hypothetical protein [Geobacter hydrogenophilus]GLI39946.1 hypothetical protein GHYDROH2_34470 [Geobacter hydrogenophilus]